MHQEMLPSEHREPFSYQNKGTFTVGPKQHLYEVGSPCNIVHYVHDGPIWLQYPLDDGVYYVADFLVRGPMFVGGIDHLVGLSKHSHSAFIIGESRVTGYDYTELTDQQRIHLNHSIDQLDQLKHRMFGIRTTPDFHSDDAIDAALYSSLVEIGKEYRSTLAHKRLAQIARTERETVTKRFSRLKEIGIAKNGGDTVVVDPNLLWDEIGKFQRYLDKIP